MNYATNKNYNYVYRITNKEINKHYYGCRSSNIEPKLDLGIKYFSSSKDKEFINEQKINTSIFKYKVIKIFSTRIEAINFEIKLHNKFDVGKNINFYNMCKQSHFGFDTSGKANFIDESGNVVLLNIYEAKQRNLLAESLGRKFSDDTKKLFSLIRTGRKHKDNTKIKMSEWQKGVSYEEKYGEIDSQIIKEKLSILKKNKTYEEIYGEELAKKLKDKRREQFSKPQIRIVCELCGKNITKNTKKRHLTGTKCKKDMI